MWNNISLNPPPFQTFEVKTTVIDLNALIILLENGIKLLNMKINNCLQTESKLLSRCVYRMQLQFRNDKGFKYAQKTNKLLKKFLNFDIIKDLRRFYDFVPKKYEKDISLPSKQMSEYVLVRLQGYVQVSKRIAESALNTAKLMNNRLALGHLWTTAAVVLGLVSRIWQICKHLTQQCCILYNDLLPLRDKLNLVGINWLEDDYEFPEDLMIWLNVDWLYENTEIISHIQLDLPIYNLIDESDDEDVKYCYQYKLNDYIIIDDDNNDDDDDDIQLIEQFSNVNIQKRGTKMEPIILGSEESDSCVEIDNSINPKEFINKNNNIIETISLSEDDKQIPVKQSKRRRRRRRGRWFGRRQNIQIELNAKSVQIKKETKPDISKIIKKEKITIKREVKVERFYK